MDNIRFKFPEKDVDVLPEELRGYNGLTSLDLSSTNIRTLPEWIGDFENLESLNLYNTEISKLPAAISKLKNLKKLDISCTNIRDIPKEIGELSELLELYAYGINISDIEFDPGCFPKLVRLDISNTKMHNIPDWICSAGSLKLLNVSQTEISQLPEAICGLTSLEMLNISYTEIRSLPKCIGNLVSLETIEASHSMLEELPEEIKELSQLRKILLANTKIRNLPDIFDYLPNIELVDLSDNSMELIPRSLAMSKLPFVWNHSRLIVNGIMMKKTSVETMPLSILYDNQSLLEDYYNAPKSVVNEIKMILLGNGDVGKSYIVKRILNEGQRLPESFDTHITAGVSINQWVYNRDGQSIQMNIWDFGGQEIMHSMHRMFLTERTLYVIVLNARYDSLQLEAERWLKTVESFAPRSSVVLVINKMDLNQFAALNESYLRCRYENLKCVIKMSAKYDSAQTFLNHLDVLINYSMAGMGGVRIPRHWLLVKNELKNIKDRLITKNKYSEICEKNGISDEKLQEWLLAWLRDIGICFVYDMDEIFFINKIILDYNWILEIIYTIIYYGRTCCNDGYLADKKRRQLLKDVLKQTEYDDYEVSMGFAIMHHFHIAYSIKSDTEFIPLLCDKNEANDIRLWCEHIDFCYEFHYDYLPVNVLHQLMMDMYGSVWDFSCWYYGFCYTDKVRGARICIKQDDTSIRIWIRQMDSSSVANASPEILGNIREKLLYISERMNLECEEFIEIRDGVYRDRLLVNRIMIMLEHGRNYEFSHILKKDIDLRRFFGNIYGFEAQEPEKREGMTIIQYFMRDVENVVNVENDSGDISEIPNEKKTIGIKKLIEGMREDIQKAETDEDYEKQLVKKYRYINIFKHCVVCLSQSQLKEFFREYCIAMQTQLSGRAFTVQDVAALSFIFCMEAWKYYQILIPESEEIICFLLFPLDVGLFPVALIYCSGQKDLTQEDLIVYMNKTKKLSALIGGEYKDIYCIKAKKQDEIFTAEDFFVHYKKDTLEMGA